MNTKRRGRPKKEQHVAHAQRIDFSKVSTLNQLNINPRMLDTMESGLSIDELFSEEGGIPCASNYMIIGDPGVGKTTILLDVLASVQRRDQNLNCLFISGEMGRKQMYKYIERFPQFRNVKTMFMADYLEHNTKDVVEQLLDMGWDLVLIDSAAEIIEGVRDDNGWDRKTAESWFVDMCVKHNKGSNDKDKYTSFLAIQQVTKQGEFVGSNKLKHMTDGMLEMRRELERDGGGCFMMFNKNRNGNVNKKLSFALSNNKIDYGILVDA